MLNAVVCCFFPTVSMMVGSCVTFWYLTVELDDSDKAQQRFLVKTQFFSAGILIAAIGTELIPKMVILSPGFIGTIVIAIGFSAGVGAMLGIDSFMEGLEDIDEEWNSDEGGASSTLGKKRTSLLYNVGANLRGAFSVVKAVPGVGKTVGGHHGEIPAGVGGLYHSTLKASLLENDSLMPFYKTRGSQNSAESREETDRGEHNATRSSSATYPHAEDRTTVQIDHINSLHINHLSSPAIDPLNSPANPSSNSNPGIATLPTAMKPTGSQSMVGLGFFGSRRSTLQNLQNQKDKKKTSSVGSNTNGYAVVGAQLGTVCPAPGSVTFSSLGRANSMKLTDHATESQVLSRRGAKAAQEAVIRAEIFKFLDLKSDVPWGTVIPILIDSIVDGLLIGILATVSLHTGLILSFGTTIEMGFLGITYGGFLKPCTPVFKYGLAILAPVLILIAGVVGNLLSDVLTSNPTAFLGIVSFGAASLLFLVTNELLREAQEGEEKLAEDDQKTNNTCEPEKVGYHHLSIYLYLGFFFIVLLERTFPEGTGPEGPGPEGV